MLRKVLSIIFYVIAGFFAFGILMANFIKISPDALQMKFLIMGFYIILVSLLLLFGLAISRFDNWKRTVGIFLLSVLGFSLLFLVIQVSIYFTPELRQIYDNEGIYFDQNFDYLSTAVYLGVLAVLALVFLRMNKKSADELATFEKIGE